MIITFSSFFKTQTMNNVSLLGIALWILLLSGCQNNPTPPSSTSSLTLPVHLVYEEGTPMGYNLHRPVQAKQVLILFPGGGHMAKDIEANFAIVPASQEANVALLCMNFNRHLWVTPTDCQELTALIEGVLKDYELEGLPIVLGGMSIGGNVAVSLGNYWNSQANSQKPAGVFVVDAPLDLYALYEHALFDAKRTDLSAQRLEEPRWIVDNFISNFGEADLLSNIQVVAPLTAANNYWENMAGLQHIPVRFYTEPDSAWWKENRQTAFERTNAHALQQWTKQLKAQGWNQLTLIETNNKGYRANGDRHPHSWSIVDVADLLQWIKKVTA